MDGPSQSRRAGLTAAVRGWPLWQLPLLLRLYIIAVSAAAVAAAAIAAARTSFDWRQLALFGILLACGLGSVEATRRTHYAPGTIVRDGLSIWCLPVAVLLPPVYALIVPAPLMALTQLRADPRHRGIAHRRAFSAATLALAYGAASVVFHATPASIAGSSPGLGSHAVWWCLAVAGCDVLAWMTNNTLIAAAIRLSDPTVQLRKEQFSPEALRADGVQWTVAVVVTATAALTPVLLAAAWPTVLVLRRGMLHGQLVSRTRIDAKTGLLNATTFEREAQAAIAGAARAGRPLAVALVDVDHFKDVNDNFGHFAGDEVLRAISGRLRQRLPDGDLAARLGGDEFELLFQGADNDAAYAIAERLRDAIAQSPIRITVPGHEGTVTVTVSIGVATLQPGMTVTDMLTAADSALYQAKDDGRNRTCAAAGSSPPAPLPGTS
jgi:diguanylate cyclase (GGDEF)-like protein